MRLCRKYFTKGTNEFAHFNFIIDNIHVFVYKDVYNTHSLWSIFCSIVKIVKVPFVHINKVPNIYECILPLERQFSIGILS